MDISHGNNVFVNWIFKWIKKETNEIRSSMYLTILMQSSKELIKSIWCFVIHQIVQPRKVCTQGKKCYTKTWRWSLLQFVTIEEFVNIRKIPKLKDCTIIIISSIIINENEFTKITHLGKIYYTQNESTNSIYYCIEIIDCSTYYIYLFIINHLLLLH